MGLAGVEDGGFEAAGIFAWLAAVDEGAVDGGAAFVCAG
jgi:hypothetical protein